MLNAGKHLYRNSKIIYCCGRNASLRGRQMSMTFLFFCFPTAR